jgi:hypothetical protein
MTDDLKEAAKEAWLYALPLIEIAATRDAIVRQGVQLNRFHHVAKLADHRARFVTTPNCDTLYSTAQIDLSAGPATLTLPASGDRYLSVALMDAYSNNFAVLGTRTTGPQGGVFTLIGPDDDAPRDALIVRAPTPRVWALARIGLSGASDLSGAQAVQRGIELNGPQVEPQFASATRKDDWRGYFAAVSALMAIDRPFATDLALLRRIAPLGLARFDPTRFSNAECDAIEAGVQEARQAARGGIGGRPIDGWFYPGADLGNFGQNYAFRAAIALGALAALPREEAMYMRAAGPIRGALFDGSKRWRLRFPAGHLPPCQSFWSLSMYEATDDGQFFFTDNPIQRYAIGDRTPNLRYEDDGALEIVMSAEAPDGDANWLPSPRNGPFALFMRAYFPSQALLNGAYRLPPVTPD